MKKLLFLAVLFVACVFLFLAWAQPSFEPVEQVEPSLPHVRASGSQPLSRSASVASFAIGGHESLPSASASSQDTGFMTPPPPGLTIVSVKEAELPPEVLAEALRAIHNLRQTGSLSGGVLTHEFAREADLRASDEGKNPADLLKKLAIIPTNLGAMLPRYQRVGTLTGGKFIERWGWTELHQLYALDNKKIELVEGQMEGGDAMQIFKEELNRQVLGFPATLERLKTAKGEPVYNVDWVVQSRRFSLSTLNEAEQTALALAEVITLQYLKMPNKGMKAPNISSRPPNWPQ